MLLAESPSFETYSSGRLAGIAARVVNEIKLEDGNSDDGFPSSVNFSNFSFMEEKEPKLGVVADAEKLNPIKQNNAEKVDENGNTTGGEGDEDDDCSEFEFHVLCGDNNSSSISADEIFSNGQIKPIYPVFNTSLVFGSGSDHVGHGFDRRYNVESKLTESSASNSSSSTPARFSLRKLFFEERETASCSSSETDDLDGVPPDTYCVWTPKESRQEMSKKSNSTGSGSSKRWKFRDLLYRSHSDGRDTFVFLTPHRQNRRQQRPTLKKIEKSKVAAEEETRSGGFGKGMAVDDGGACGTERVGEKHYLKNRAVGDGDRKKSFLPYRPRPGLVGFIANVSGLTRAIQPF